MVAFSQKLLSSSSGDSKSMDFSKLNSVSSSSSPISSSMLFCLKENCLTIFFF